MNYLNNLSAFVEDLTAAIDAKCRAGVSDWSVKVVSDSVTVVSWSNAKRTVHAECTIRAVPGSLTVEQYLTHPDATHEAVDTTPVGYYEANATDLMLLTSADIDMLVDNLYEKYRTVDFIMRTRVKDPAVYQLMRAGWGRTDW